MSLWELRFKYNLTWNRLSRCNKHQIPTGHLSTVVVSIPILFKSFYGRSWLLPHSFSLFSDITNTLPLGEVKSSYLSCYQISDLFSHWPLLSPTVLALELQQHCLGWSDALPDLLNISTAQRNLWYLALQATCAWLPSLDQSCWSPSQVFE